MTVVAHDETQSLKGLAPLSLSLLNTAVRRPHGADRH